MKATIEFDLDNNHEDLDKFTLLSNHEEVSGFVGDFHDLLVAIVNNKAHRAPEVVRGIIGTDCDLEDLTAIELALKELYSHYNLDKLL